MVISHSPRKDLMVVKAANKLYQQALLLSLMVVGIFFIVAVLFDSSLVSTGDDILPEGIRVDPTAFVNKGYSLNSINKTINEVTPFVKEILNESDRFNINNVLYYNFFFLTFKWISFSSLVVLNANHTYFHNLLFKRIRLINGDRRLYSALPFIYSSIIFTISFFFAFSLCFILLYAYDEFFDYTQLSVSSIIISITIAIVFSTFIYVLLAAVCVKRKTLVISAIVINFTIPFITTVLSLASRDGYIYYLVFSFVDPSSILISMVRNGWQAGYEYAPQQKVDGVAVEIFKLWKRVIDKNITSFSN